MTEKVITCNTTVRQFNTLKLNHVHVLCRHLQLGWQHSARNLQKTYKNVPQI